MIRKKDVKIVLSRVKGFKNPVPELEQYMTPPDVAADMLNIVRLHKKNGYSMVDLGSGTGMISFAGALYGFSVKSVEKDPKAVTIMRKNLGMINKNEEKNLDISIINKDVRFFKDESDVVVMNPPFGIQERDKNLVFLKKAFETSENVFALLHRSEKKEVETRKFLKRFADFHNFSATILKTYQIQLPRKMFFHEKTSKAVNMDFYYFEKKR